jgi:hypothetical protein
MRNTGRSRTTFVVTCVVLVAVAAAVIIGLQVKYDRQQDDLTKPVGSITTQAVVNFEADVAATTQRAAGSRPASPLSTTQPTTQQGAPAKQHDSQPAPL